MIDFVNVPWSVDLSDYASTYRNLDRYERGTSIRANDKCDSGAFLSGRLIDVVRYGNQ